MQNYFRLYILVFILCLLQCLSTTAQKNYLLVGTYTSGKSEGIYVYDFDTANGRATFVSSIKSSNPSYLTAVNNKYVYAVNENDTGSISAYNFANGQLSFINSKPSLGRHPCYISTRQWSGKTTVIAGNYSSGNLVLYGTNSNGAITNALQTIQHSGSSANEVRQKSAHVHATVVSPFKQYLYAPDLGMDKVFIYHFDPFGEKLDSNKYSTANSIAGSGPRHITFHPTKKYAYLIEELSGTVKVCKVKLNGKLKQKQIISSLPKEYEGNIGSADIHVLPNGKYLYASNRGDANSIAIFSINKKNGKLTSVGFQSVLGSKPRNFNFTPNGNFLLIANQDSNEIVVFKVDNNTGLLQDTGNRIQVPNPVCLVWIDQQ